MDDDEVAALVAALGEPGEVEAADLYDRLATVPPPWQAVAARAAHRVVRGGGLALVQAALEEPAGSLVRVAAERWSARSGVPRGGWIRAVSVPPLAAGWVRTFERARWGYDAVQIHPDGRRLLAADRDGSVTVWDLDDGRPLRRFPSLLSTEELDDVRSVELLLHPDRARLLVRVSIIDCRDVALCWHLDRGDLVESFGDARVPHVLLGDELAVTAGGLTLTVWELESGRERRVMRRTDRSWHLLDAIAAPAEGGGPVALVRGPAALEVWDLERSALRWSALPGEVRAAAALPGGDVALVREQAIEIRALATGALVRTLPCEALRASGAGDDVPIAVARTGSLAVIGAGAPGGLIAVDLSTGAVRSTFAAPGDRPDVRISDDGSTTVVWSWFHDVSTVWETATGRCRLRAGAEVVLAPDGRSAITLEEDVLRLWRLDDDGGEPRDAGDRAAAPAWSAQVVRCPAGRVRCVAGADAEVDLRTVDGGELLASLRTRAPWPRVLAVEADARRIAIAAGRTIELWRGHPPQRIHTFRDDSPAGCAALDPSARWLVSGHADGGLRLWDTIARRHEGTVLGHAGDVLAVAIAPGTGRVVSAGRDAVVRGWAVDGLRPLARWDGDHPARALMWEDDETIVATTDRGALVLRWR